MQYDASTTVMEAVEQLASQIKLENYQTFSLFMVHKVRGGGKELGQIGREQAGHVCCCLFCTRLSITADHLILPLLCCRASPATKLVCRPLTSTCCVTTTASSQTSCAQLGEVFS